MSKVLLVFCFVLFAIFADATDISLSDAQAQCTSTAGKTLYSKCYDGGAGIWVGYTADKSATTPVTSCVCGVFTACTSATTGSSSYTLKANGNTFIFSGTAAGKQDASSGSSQIFTNAVASVTCPACGASPLTTCTSPQTCVSDTTAATGVSCADPSSSSASSSAITISARSIAIAALTFGVAASLV